MMSNHAFWWLGFNILSVIVLAFYSMMEMACVSLNRVRLHYYVSKGNPIATRLHELLSHPSKLFGTTLIGVNVALIVGSELAREFHQAIGISPDWAPLSQVFFVVIFGELAPMFAARHYSESVALLGGNILYASSKILAPFIWMIGIISKLSIKLLHGKDTEETIFISQEELLKILETRGDVVSSEESQDELNQIASNIFSLRSQTVKQIMTPIEVYPKIPSNSTVENVRSLLKKNKINSVPIYHHDFKNITQIVYPRDLLRAADHQKAKDFAKQPWFVTENTSTTEILHQFRLNHESIAVILDNRGRAVGFVTLEDVLEELFGTTDYFKKSKDEPPQRIVERTLPGDMLVSDFNDHFHVVLSTEEELTISQLLTKELGHIPEPGDAIFLPPFELIAKETTFLGVKSVEVKTRIK